MSSSFAFIFSCLVFDVPLPYRLTETLSIAPASHDQLEKIVPRLQLISSLLPWAHFPYQWDAVKKVIPNDEVMGAAVAGEHFQWDYEPVPLDQWRYWVINGVSPTDFRQVEQAFLLQT